MTSQSNNIGTTAIIIFIILLLFGGLYYASLEISDRNDKLDISSQQTLDNIGVEYQNNLNFTLESESTEEFNDSNFDGVDAFVRQYLEDKSEIQQKRTLLNKILLFPSIIISVFGVENNILLITFSTLVYSLLVFLLSLQVIKAIKGEVD